MKIYKLLFIIVAMVKVMITDNINIFMVIFKNEKYFEHYYSVVKKIFFFKKKKYIYIYYNINLSLLFTTKYCLV